MFRLGGAFGAGLGDGFLVRLVDVHEEWLAALGVLLEA